MASRYTKDKYATLTPKQKKELASKRLKRGHKPGGKDSKVVNKTKAKVNNKDVIHNLKKVVSHRVAQLAKQMSKTGADDKTADSTSVASTTKCNGKCGGGANRTNPSLTRQEKTQSSDPKK